MAAQGAKKSVTTGETYIDANGNKVVEPIYNGNGGTANGTISVVKR